MVGQEPIRVVGVDGQSQVLTVLGPDCCLVNMLVFAGYQAQLNVKLSLFRILIFNHISVASFMRRPMYPARG